MSGLRRAFVDDVAAAGLQWSGPAGDPITAEELDRLPEAVRRYLTFMDVVAGGPRHRSFEARFTGRFRRTPRERWMTAEAHQYDVASAGRAGPGRISTMRLRFAGVLPMIGHDSYVRGSGRMLGKLFDRITVADGTGEEFDVGELVTYLNDAILLAPSMLLGPSTTWRGLDDSSFEVRLTDAGRTVSATVTLDARGAPIDFTTNDRFASLPEGPVRATWTTPVSAWVEVGGRMVPGPARATWLLDDGPFTYVEGRFVPESIRFDVPPPTA